jgi:hypothetical protein
VADGGAKLARQHILPLLPQLPHHAHPQRLQLPIELGANACAQASLPEASRSFQEMLMRTTARSCCGMAVHTVIAVVSWVQSMHNTAVC